MSSKTIKKILIIILLIVVLSLNGSEVFATDLVNTEDQYMELKVVSVEDIDGGDQKVTLEWWSYNLSFKALDLRFSYDETKLKPSSVQDNSYVTDETSFEFAGDFASYMGYMVLSAEDGEYRCVMSLDKYDDSGTYIENDESFGYIVNTNVDGGVLIGRMSFRLFSGQIDETTFALKIGETSPKTGIEISQTQNSGYSDQSVFRFSVLSKDASLNKIEYDFFNYDKEEGQLDLPQITYESLDLSNKDTDSTDAVSKYTIKLLEDLDNISLKLEKSDENATIKIDNIEIDVTNSKELVLKNLGEGDTIIDIVVTAQDGTVHTYKLVVQRPYGTIKGTIELGEGLRDSIAASYGTYVEYIANATVYEADVFDWDGIVPGNTSLNDLDLFDEKGYDETDKDDGSYTIYVIPGKYDLILERGGFLANVVRNIDVSESDVINLGNRKLPEGDTDRTGIIDLNDIVATVNMNDTVEGDGVYNEIYDFGQKGFVAVDDLVSVVNNMDRLINIEDF